MNGPRSLDLLDARLLPLCDAILTATQVPGASIALVVADQAYYRARGVKSMLTGEPVSIDTSFNIGSCSKAFVSATLAALAADGVMGWDDPIAKWVPEFQLYDPAITRLVTLRDLSANRIGLARLGLTECGLDPRFPAEHVFERLRHTPPAFPFRDRFGYVNAGHSANAVAAGRATGEGFLSTLRKRILAPLGMTTTSGGAATCAELSDLAGWHAVLNGRPVAIDPIFTDQSLGAGEMSLSGRDALQWLRLHLNAGLVDGRQVVARDALLETHRPHAVATPGKDPMSLFYPAAKMAAYGLGWGVSDLEGHPLLMHSGSDLGVTAMTLLLPADGIGIAVYCNSNGGGPAALALAHALAATLLGLRPRDWLTFFESCMPALPTKPERRAVAQAPVNLALYEGTFEHPADGPLVVRKEGGRLTGCLSHAYRMTFELEPAGEHRFLLQFTQPEWQAMSADERPQMTFAVEAGQAKSIELSSFLQGRIFVRATA